MPQLTGSKQPFVPTAGNALAPQSGETAKVEKSPLEVAGNAMSTLGKANANPETKGILEKVGIAVGGIAKGAVNVVQSGAQALVDSPKAQNTLANLATAIGTSPSGVQSAGARAGQAFVQSSQANQAANLEERKVEVVEGRLDLAELNFELEQDLAAFEANLSLDRIDTEMQVFNEITKPASAANTKRADAAMIAANASLKNATTQELNSQIARAKTDFAGGKASQEQQLSLLRVVHQQAKNVASDIRNAGRQAEAYQEEYKSIVDSFVAAGINLPLGQIVGATLEEREQFLIDNAAESIKTITAGTEGQVQTGSVTTTGLGDDGVVEAPTNAGDLLAGIFPGGKSAQVKTKAAEAETERVEQFRSRIKHSTEPAIGPTAAALGVTRQGAEIEPEGTGSVEKPWQLTTLSKKHEELIEGLVVGTYFDLDGQLYRVTSKGGYTPQ